MKNLAKCKKILAKWRGEINLQLYKEESANISRKQRNKYTPQSKNWKGECHCLEVAQIEPTQQLEFLKKTNIL